MSTDAETGPTPNEGASDENASDERVSHGMRADWMDALREVAPYLDLGWRIAGAAAIPPIVGWGVDVWLETLPWGVSIGALLGLVTAAVQLRQVGDELDTRSASTRADLQASDSGRQTASEGASNQAETGAYGQAE